MVIVVLLGSSVTVDEHNREQMREMQFLHGNRCYSRRLRSILGLWLGRLFVESSLGAPEDRAGAESVMILRGSWPRESGWIVLRERQAGWRWLRSTYIPYGQGSGDPASHSSIWIGSRKSKTGLKTIC